MDRKFVWFIILIWGFCIVLAVATDFQKTKESKYTSECVVIDGELYAFMEDDLEGYMGHLGAVEEFDYYLEDGIYTITWSGDIYKNSQDIVKIYDETRNLAID